MKKLCLFRHSKSTYVALGVDDIQRPLHETGQINAPLMAAVLKDHYKFQPDLILTSHAKRAVDTAALVSEALGHDKSKIQIHEKLYEAGVEDLLHEIKQIDAKFNSVLLIGHNPGLTLLANFLADEHVNNLATSGVFAMEFDTKTWEDISNADSKLIFSDEPKNHKSQDD